MCPPHSTADRRRFHHRNREKRLAPRRVAGGIIWLDDKAAGWGWFVDATPWEDSEFTTPGDQGEVGRMDLLTVLEHEVGHLLGRDHEADGVMQEELTAGTRRSVDPVLAADSVALSAAETPWIGGRQRGRGSKR